MGFALNLRDVTIDDDGVSKSCFERPDAKDKNTEPRLVGNNIPNTQKSSHRKGKRKQSGGEKPSSAKRPKNAEKAKNTSRASGKPVELSLICGVDFGTTYTGVSYRTNLDSTQSVKTIMDWRNSQASGQSLSKTPSRIAYRAENHSRKTGDMSQPCDLVGYEVEPAMTSYTWFKLLLDGRTDPDEYGDDLLYSMVGQGTLKLPDGKTAVNVAADYLRIVRKSIMAHLTRSVGPDIMEKTPIHYWVTVPAIWDDIAYMRMCNAVESAGFKERSIDEYSTVTEPEAAAVAVVKQFTEQAPGMIKQGICFPIIDIGGGTIDVQSLEVKGTHPLKLKEIGPGDGSKTGSTAIDRSFMAFMIGKFGNSFLEIPEHKRGPGSSFMAAFESQKKSFGSNASLKYRIEFSALAIQLEREQRGVECFKDGEVIFGKNEMIGFFTKTLSEVLRLVQMQVDMIQECRGRLPDFVILVGGLAGSEYILQKVSDFCRETYGTELKVLRPENAWSAISRGAVEYGLDRSVIVSRKARRHYGIVARRRFEEGVDPEERAVTCSLYGKRVGGCLTTLLRKGDEIRDRHRHSHDCGVVVDDPEPETWKFSWNIICSNRDEKPEWDNDPGCYVIGQIKINLTRVMAKKIKEGHSLDEVAQKPIEIPLNIVTTGGHGAGVLCIAARAGRILVGELVLNCTT